MAQIIGASYTGRAASTSTHDSFQPTVWINDIRRYIEQKFVGRELVQMWSDPGLQAGQEFIVPTIGRSFAQRVVEGQAVNYNTTGSGKWSIKVTWQSAVTQAVTNLLDIQSKYKTRSIFTREMAYAAMLDMEFFILGMRAAVPAVQQIILSSNNLATGDPLPLTEEAILAAIGILKLRRTPEDNIRIAGGVDAWLQLMAIDKRASRDYVDGRPRETGEVSRMFGFPFLYSNSIQPNATGIIIDETGTIAPAPGVAGSPYLPTQDAVVGTGLPRGKTGAEAAQPFVTTMVYNPEWCRFVMRDKSPMYSEYDQDTDIWKTVQRQLFDARLWRSEQCVLIHHRGSIIEAQP